MYVQRKYQEYLQSNEWGFKRASVIQREQIEQGVSTPVCQRCRHRDGTEVHHKSYAHIYDERLEELELLCHSCHNAEYERGRYEKSTKRRQTTHPLYYS